MFLKSAKYSASQPEYSVISESDWTKVEVRKKEKKDNHDNRDGAVGWLKKSKRLSESDGTVPLVGKL